MRKQIKLTFLLATILLAIVFMASCSKPTRNGAINTNVPPTVAWADIQVPHNYTQNPVLRYYSTDKDGLVLDYQLYVIVSDVVESMGGPEAAAAAVKDTASWSIVHKDSATVQLYSSQNPDSAVEQYVFLRAMDDDSAFSPIIYKNLSRQNHAPTCYVVLPTGPQWCLPETTATWHGIRIAWVGKDSIDIPGVQPDFQWKVKIYGPFADSAATDTAGFLHMELADTNEVTGQISTWIWDKSALLTNLRTGWYNIYAMNRDDAFVPAIPAVGYIRVYEPEWEAPNGNPVPILLVKHNRYARTRNLGSSGDLISIYRDSVDQFYMQMLDGAGYRGADVDSFVADVNGAERPVPISELYRHKLVIALDTDLGFQFTADQLTAYGDYLNAGGMLWVIGRRSFENNSAERAIEYGGFPVNYLDLSGAYCEKIGNFPNAEFTGALPIGDSLNLPALNVDTMKVHQTWGDSTRTNFWHALKGIDYIIRLGNSTPLYKYVAIHPDTSNFNDFPVALRCDRSTYRSAYFAFPLYFIQADQATLVTQRMLEWFFAPRPE